MQSQENIQNTENKTKQDIKSKMMNIILVLWPNTLLNFSS